MSDMIGRTLGPYRIVEQLGMGGMATVYKAYHAAMDRHVGIKVLPRHFASDPTFVGRFEQEAKVIAKLENPRILPVYGYGEEDGITYIVMRYLDAGTLSERIKGGDIAPPEIARIMGQIAEGLDYAHKKGVIHRDIKPSNIMLDQNGDVYITDFGISKLVEGTAQFTGSGIVGTPDYVSPEQAMGQPIDSRSDIYSLGIVLYQMATHDVPFHAETPMAVIIKHINDPLPLPRTINPNLSEAVENVILKALAKKPDERFQTCGELATALKKAVDSGLSPERLPTKMGESTKPMAVPQGAAPQGQMEAGTVPMGAVSAASAQTVPHKTDAAASQPKKKRSWLVPALIVGGLLMLLVGGFVVLRTIQRVRESNAGATMTAVADGVGVVQAPVTEPAVGIAAAPATQPGVPNATQPAATDNIIFKDEFNGAGPKAAWKPLNITPDLAGMQDGQFKLGVQSGSTFVDLALGRPQLGLPVLVFAIPHTLAEYTVQVDLGFQPTQDFELAGLILLAEGPAGRQQVPLFALGRGFCDNSVCQGDAIYFDSTISMAKDVNNYHPYVAGAGQLSNGVVTLRLTHLHSRIIGQYSLDKQTWHAVGEWPVPPENITLIGLGTNAGGQTVNPDSAYFDNFVLMPPQP